MGTVPLTKRTSDIQCVSKDNEHGHIHLTRDDTKRRKRSDNETLQCEQSTNQVKPEGTVIDTHHPRQIPNEILVHIIEHVAEQPRRLTSLDDSRWVDQQRDLHACTLVNKQFYFVANPVLWQETVLDTNRTRLQRLLDCLAATERRLGHYIRRLDLNNASCTDSELLLLTKHIRRLETLSIKNVDFTYTSSRITSTGLQHLPQDCPELTSLKLLDFHLSEATICAIGQHCPQLTEFTLCSIPDLNDDMLSALSSCPLKSLSLSFDRNRRPLSEKMVMDMTRFRDLTHLSLSFFEPSGLIMTLANNLQRNNGSTTTTTTTTKTTTTTMVPWPHLKTLSLDRCGDIDDATFISFIQSHPHLHLLRLEGTTLSDACLDAIPATLRDLRELFFESIDGISARGVRRFIQNCQGLEFAEFRRCAQFVAGDVVPNQVYNPHILHLNKRLLAKIRRAQGTGTGH
ncbi:hypothetical protein BCR42DRAFT_421405 [Absidia repens]|uniref:Uncharacterized protein n=1 Tax=Absidia repens TaxID=90262 RepID=A0A1X2I8J0_9FUNG|nr:hypothetical protein BCR42DRAFT_421405 [Absidia repens]